MLTARSSAEAHLYMDLHRCECGSGEFDRQHRLELHGDDLVAVYEGACGQCGRTRRFEFRMIEEIPPPPPAFGGAEPSQIIDPGEFEAVAGRLAESTGIQLLNTPGSEHHRLRGAMAYVVAAYEEMLKFLPPGQDSIPASAFVSEVGKARYRRDPGNFDRDILEMNVRDARAVLANIDKHNTPPGSTDLRE
ncbi:hypothetical protein ACSCB1_39895 [Streptomyces europaeiscabiei]|uniref:hypothetical protein n=1 Tax=Streptomyces europaeiscabiei TaxID=146819 RepID=UPI000628368E|nr:hypothetical protein [Streptomyces europaeiscabiei]MDX2528488.1 hypothetical protein [Streptomyces europaeiscabiei]MDX2765854.1 hypothetical protein [Streptomyces europaeiscabiei]MDX3841206.1 hypothetical protein [Streptomyces europaeiscabiei]MDX3864548.1 hypothetical protein [Streptomyces europaeiscabiei]MDX3871370.1 hypothetical protein [Streptomyces europaeiscabiei]